MTRRVQMLAAGMMAVLGVAGPASAQPSAADRPIAFEVSGGGSFGNTSSGTVGVEGDYSITSSLAVFAELAYDGNVAPRFVTDRANVIAAILGGSARVKDKATLFDVGAKYFFKPVLGGALKNMLRSYDPYVGIDGGVARVMKNTTMTISGSELDESQLLSQYGVQLGNDLAGSLTKGTFGVLLGVSRDFRERYALDLSYRYTRIFPKTTEIEGDKGINVSRLQVGVIVRF